MRHTPTQSVIPPPILSNDFLQSISPSQSASPSVAQYSAGLAHDARNMLAAMDIYCELLAGPGVLKPEDKHLLDELGLLRDSSGKLLDRLLIEALKCLSSSDSTPGGTRDRPGGGQGSAASGTAPRTLSGTTPSGASQQAMAAPLPGSLPHSGRPADPLPSALIHDPADTHASHAHAEVPADTDVPSDREGDEDRASTRLAEAAVVMAGAATAEDTLATTISTAVPHGGGKRVTSLAAELRANLPMLSALAGPRVEVSLDLGVCPEGEFFMPAVDLTRVLINLVRNAAEAMSVGGRIVIAATASTMPGIGPDTRERSGETPAAVMISIEDNGPGIPLSLLHRIFDLQASGATAEQSLRSPMQFRPRGLGLRIVREFVEAGGGSVRALRLPDRGSRFEIVLPLVTVNVT